MTASRPVMDSLKGILHYLSSESKPILCPHSSALPKESVNLSFCIAQRSPFLTSMRPGLLSKRLGTCHRMA